MHKITDRLVFLLINDLALVGKMLYGSRDHVVTVFPDIAI